MNIRAAGQLAVVRRGPGFRRGMRSRTGSLLASYTGRPGLVVWTVGLVIAATAACLRACLSEYARSQATHRRSAISASATKTARAWSKIIRKP